MDFEEYQRLSKRTAVYPDVGKNIVYPTLGLASEAGEVASKVKKAFRDHGGIINEERREDIKKELGDVLWYVAQIASELGLELDTIASHNIDKLASRHERQTLGGDGDNR